MSSQATTCNRRSAAYNDEQISLTLVGVNFVRAGRCLRWREPRMRFRTALRACTACTVAEDDILFCTPKCTRCNTSYHAPKRDKSAVTRFFIWHIIICLLLCPYTVLWHKEALWHLDQKKRVMAPDCRGLGVRNVVVIGLNVC